MVLSQVSIPPPSLIPATAVTPPPLPPPCPRPMSHRSCPPGEAALPSLVHSGYPPTAIGYPPTAVGYPPTAIGYPPTAVGYPPTAIVGRIGHSDSFFFVTAPPAPACVPGALELRPMLRRNHTLQTLGLDGAQVTNAAALECGEALKVRPHPNPNQD